MFESFRTFETTLAGRPFVVEVGKMAGLANGSCLVRYGDTTVLVNVTASPKPREGIDFFPLSVDFEEKLYSVGKIPGSFLKREGRPTDKAILVCRMIDRPIRPLFPKDMRNDVSIVCTVMSVDPDCSPEIAALVGTSVALSISDIPWDGPISGVSVGLIDGEFIINPTAEQRKLSQMAVTVASTDERIAMIEAGANEVSDEDMFNGIMAGHAENQKIIEFIKGIQREIGKEKFSYPSNKPDPEMFEEIRDFAIDDVKAALDTDDKTVRDERLKPVYEKVHEHFDEIYPDQAAKIDECMYLTQKFVVRRWLLDEQKRVDGRGMDEIRPLAAEVGLLPRVHGSGMFTRGQTQVLTICTLGSTKDAQLMDDLCTVLAGDRPCYLFLDDFHLLKDEKAAKFLCGLANRLPENVHLIVASRNNFLPKEEILRLGQRRSCLQYHILPRTIIRDLPVENTKSGRNCQTKSDSDDPFPLFECFLLHTVTSRFIHCNS